MSAAKSQSKPLANRIEPRAVVLPKAIKGIITFHDANNEAEQQPFIVYDVSKKGIGIWTSFNIPIGIEIDITISYPYVLQLKGETRWISENGTDGYRCGILITHNQAKLEALFDSFCKLAERIVSRT